MLKRHTMAMLILVGAIGGAFTGVALVGQLPTAQAQSGANTRQFDVGDANFPPMGELGEFTLGNISGLTLNRDYRLMLTAVVNWSDSGLAERNVSLAIDVDGFDANGVIVGDWDSEIHAHTSQVYVQSLNTSRDRVMIAQSITHVPSTVAILKASVIDQSGVTAPTPIQFRQLRFTMTPTGPPF